jgi:hypothetical protein
VPLTVSAIVGAHFLALARLFGERPYVVTGGTLISWAIATALAAGAADGRGMLWTAVPTVGTTVVLWLTGTALLIESRTPRVPARLRTQRPRRPAGNLCQ